MFFILERQTDFPSRLIKSHPPSLLAVSQLDNMKTEACANRFTDLSDVHFDDRRKKNLAACGIPRKIPDPRRASSSLRLHPDR